MRRHAAPALLAIAVMLGAGGARAAPLVEATWFQVAQGVPLTRTFQQLGFSGDSTATAIAVSITYPAFSTMFFVPKDPTTGVLDLAITITQGGPQRITATASMGTATQGIPGTVVVMTASHLVGGMALSMFNVGANTLVAVPLSHGEAGQFTTTFKVLGAAHQRWTSTPGRRAR